MIFSLFYWKSNKPWANVYIRIRNPYRFFEQIFNHQSTFLLEFANSIVEKDGSQIFSTWLIIQMERIQCIFDNEGLDRSEQCSKLNALYKNHFTEQNSSIPAVEKVIKN